MKKILAITGIRSDYDLMSSLFNRLNNEPSIDLRLLVGGAHMSRTYGYTIDQIRKDGFQILMAIESLIDSDSPASRIKTASIMLQSAVDVVANWMPDLIIYAGDREEVLIGAMLGAYLEVPTVHFYGGDHTKTGHVDNPVRHAVSKLSTVHAVALDEHKSRLVRMGEPESRVRIIGNMSLDNFVKEPTLSRDELEHQICLPKDYTVYAIVLFHPDPSERNISADIMKRILDSLIERDIFCCIGYPNTDPSNRDIINLIEQYSKFNDIFVYQNLNRSQFISMYKHASFIIGNSSSGIMEAASIPIPSINVGLRQRGRLAADNVIFCESNMDSIGVAIDQAVSPAFRQKISQLINPYGIGNSSEKAFKMLMETDFDALRLKTEDPLILR